MINLKKIKRILSSFLASTLMIGITANATPITKNEVIDEETKIISQYIEGEKILPEQIEARKNKAEELNLLDWVDENYFLVDDFYRGKSEADIEALGANILVNTVTNEELDSWASNIKNGISPLTVTYYEMVSYGQSTVGKFEVDGRMAFCAEHSQTTPAKGSSTSQATLNNNELVRKVLYYGYGGPEQLSDMTGNYGWVMTSLGLSKAYTGTGGTNATNFVNRVSNLPSPPSSFKVYIVQTNGGSTQDLAYWEYNPIQKGKVQIQKSSSNPEVTDNNNCYSLEGAVYGLFTDASATNKIADLTTNADGTSNIVEVDAGVYWVKELQAPPGFALDETVYSVTVTADNIAVVRCSDIPLLDPINMIVKKVDAITGTEVVTGQGTLEGAEFTVKYYKGEWNENQNPAEQGINPERVWVFRTNKNGFVRFEEASKISGDELYYDATGAPSIPKGLITIEETKAPEGYIRSTEVFIRKITQNAGGMIPVFNTPVVQETPIMGNVKITKVDAETGDRLSNATFKLYSALDDSEIGTITTGEDGTATLENVPYGKYYASEFSQPEGYLLNDEKYPVTIEENGKTYEIIATNQIIKGKIQVIKIDAQDAEKPVEGATFGVYANNVLGIEKDTLVDTVTTDVNGFAYTKDLRFGGYYLQELAVGDNYWLNGKKYYVTISENEKIEVVHIKNEPVQMKLRVLKYDADSESKEVIKGTKFKVVNKETGEDVEFTEFFGIIPYKKTVFTTNKNGEIVFPQILEAGIYSLVETEPAEGFNAIEPIDFVINRDTNYEEIELLGKVTTIEVENTRIKGNLKIVKIDEETQEPLEGVKFKITCTDGFMEEQEWIELTDENGEINLTDLEYGTYEAVEIEGLWNYVENKEPIKFEIKENGKTIELTVTNKKIRGSVELLKVDEDTNRLLEGAEFELWNGEKLVGIYTTDKDGKIVVEDLEAGNYYWKEVVAPNNYNVNDDAELYFSILEDKEVIKLEVSNKVKEGEVDFSKTDVSTGDLIEGATIHIKGLDEQNSHIDFEFVSTKEETRFKLPVGRYEFSETIAPEGFVISTEVGYFEILENEVIKAELKNKRIEGTLEFEKTDVSTGEVIEGAHIQIECVEGFNKGQVIEFISSAEGNKFGLEYGKYKFYETLPPDGYELTTEVGEFEISEDGQIVKAELKNKRIAVPVLPQTGGTDTVVVISLALVVTLAGAMMFRKKKAN
ncbi:SpaA isopeptide-forming pilin-related protein [Clostridium cuniculi]|uniref:SpaA isopeptide-forming pilin-related protein n=1 Tax=Clostridium cuniculi TaxID=2548455 RepID=UPI0010557584|nr:SpaA isopeptide-forming pilin-related protein [Clostridium cuniculi]